MTGNIHHITITLYIVISTLFELNPHFYIYMLSFKIQIDKLYYLPIRKFGY